MSSADSSIPPVILPGGDSGLEADSIRIAPQGPGIQQRLAQNVGSTGRSVSAAEYRSWQLGGSYAHRGWLYAQLPAAGLQPLSALFDLTRRHALWILERYCRAAEFLAQREERELRAINLQTVFFDEEGTIYFLPAPVEETAAKNLPEEEQERWFRRWVPGYLGGEEAAAYQNAALLFSLLAGRHPVGEEQPVIIHPHLHVPDLAPEPADLLYRLLRGEAPLQWGKVQELISRCREGSAFDSPANDELRRRTETAESIYRRRSAGYRRRRRLKRIAPPLAVSAAVVLVFLLLFSPLFRGGEQPATAGLTPEEVVQLFYRSHNSLDHETMSDCVTTGTASGHMHEVTTLFVINRVRQGVEGIRPFMSVEEWKRQGRPSPGRDTFVYGVDGLSIQPRGEKSFLVEYSKYTTLPPKPPDEKESGDTDDQSVREQAEEIESTGRVRAFRITERLRLRETGEGWKIAELEVLERQQVRE